MATLAIFPSGTEFGDVDGVPVSRQPGDDCFAWSKRGPRLYPCAEFHRARRMTEARFRQWVDGRAWSPYATGAPRESMP